MAGQTMGAIELWYEISCYFCALSDPNKTMKQKGGPFQGDTRRSEEALRQQRAVGAFPSLLLLTLKMPFLGMCENLLCFPGFKQECSEAPRA